MPNIPIHHGSPIPVFPGIGGGDCGALTDCALGIYAISDIADPFDPVAYLIYPSDVPERGSFNMLHRLPLASRTVNYDPPEGTILLPVGAIPCDPDDYSTADWGGRLLKLAIFISPESDT